MLDPIHALARLKIGNERFVANASALDITSARRRELSKGQDPYAIVLGCADSRVPTEVVFDQGLGELFVIRVAGNIVQPSQIGSVEFAIQHFGTRLVVVLGHTGCGAITATIEELKRPEEEESANIASIVSRIRPAIEGLIDQIDDPDELERHAVRENVRFQSEALRRGSTIVEYLVDKGDLIIVGAEYNLESGVVDFFDGMPE